MKTRNQKFNPKRKMLDMGKCDLQRLSALANDVKYGGNPEHKKNPGDFNLTPPMSPRPGKSLCDAVKIFTKKEALELLQKGLRNGLVSDHFQGK
jgi:hypothetical protein